MIGTNFADDLDCGFLDQIDDLLDFPNEDVDVGLPAADSAAFPNIWPTQSDSFPASDSVFIPNPEISVPYDEIVQLEWLSNFVDDSFSGGNLAVIKKEDEDSFPHQFQSSSPVSVLESSSSSLIEKTEITPGNSAGGKRGRARSKRPRPAAFNPRPNQLISPTSSVNENDSSASAPNLLPPRVPSDSDAESRILIKIPRQFNPEKPKKKKVKTNSSPETNQNPQTVRKCMHCEITKTPQWRAGPMGPKTLCNACGVRYKSGRLFPEYRPAASPTFVPSIHSNSHKKVVEMRNKFCSESVENPPELIPNDTNPAIDYILGKHIT